MWEIYQYREEDFNGMPHQLCTVATEQEADAILLAVNDGLTADKDGVGWGYWDKNEIVPEPLPDTYLWEVQVADDNTWYSRVTGTGTREPICWGGIRSFHVLTILVSAPTKQDAERCAWEYLNEFGKDLRQKLSCRHEGGWTSPAPGDQTTIWRQLNDWLTYLPNEVADAAYVIGQWIAPLFN